MADQIVAELPLQPPRLSLADLAVDGFALDAAGIGVVEGDRWTGGMTWWPQPAAGLYGYDNCAPGTVTTLIAPVKPGKRSYKPPILQAEFDCSTLGMNFDIYKARASALMNEMAPTGIGMEFWAGPLTIAASTGNPYLTQDGLADVLNSGTAVDIHYGIALLEQFIADNIHTRGMIHMQPQCIPPTGLRFDGKYLTTQLGTIIVPDYGYNGYGPETDAGDGGTVPDAGTTWMYATGLVVVRQSADEMFPDPENASDQDQLRQAVNRGLNTATVRVDRYIAATVDNPAIGAVLVTLDS